MVQNDIMNNRAVNYIIVGDTGEKDEEAGERIAKKFGASKIRAVFLHTVSDSPDRSLVLLPKDRMMNGVPIFYFRTYVGAASKAFQNRLMSAEGLQRVIDTAKTELINLETKIPKSKISSLESIILSRRSELEIDILEAKSKKRSASFSSAFVSVALTNFPQNFRSMMLKR